MLYLLTTIVNKLDHSTYKSISIFLISFFSNTFSAISGGGAGLIQLPALILSGIPYYQALASHKLATVALGIGGSLRNYQSLRNDIYLALQILIFGLPGVIFGASIVKFISEQYLYLILGIFSILLAFYSFLTVGIFWNFTGAIFLSKIGSLPSNILILLIIGSFTGGYLGAHLSKLKGNILIKKTFTIVCLLVGISLILKSIMNFLN